MEITEEQRRRAEANRLAALEKRKRAAEVPDLKAWRLAKCRKVPAPTPADLGGPALEPVLEPELPPRVRPPPSFRVVVEICSPEEFSVTPEPSEGSPFPGEIECLQIIEDCLSSVVPFCSTVSQGGQKTCVFRLSDYELVLRCLKKLPRVELQDIPYPTRLVVQKFSHCVGDYWVPSMEGHYSDEQVDELIRKLPKLLRDALLPFQLEGVRFGLRRGGRCLIADEMGLGKTIQAIAIASCFQDEGPILVVCPAVLRFSWAEELEHWLPQLLPRDIHLVFGHQNNLDHLERYPKVVIISYTMLNRLRKSMLERKWALLIVDESHNIRCTKKKSESEETKAVLEVAAKVKRIILLSGTPSLSRPRLLGNDKYEFARNYCLMRPAQGCQGRIYMDFSKGIRLGELNVLLRQALMIRRLKEHVLTQLPPKRRQIIRLMLKAADILLATTSYRVSDSICMEREHKNGCLVNGCSSKCTTHIDKELENINTGHDNNGKKTLKQLSDQEIGIAKLSGFCQWFSNHLMIRESEDEASLDLGFGPQKTIIFAHHLKVLDGIQEFICEKHIKFVRIDGRTLARDRQDAVETFRYSMEVKMAIIGITAGGVGLDFSSAKNVVFLELPKSASELIQAEDRAHRRGQKNSVNIYIFCAKDTSDESRWLRINKSLFRVSSMMNGKRDAIREIEVERVFNVQYPCSDVNCEDVPIDDSDNENSGIVQASRSGNGTCGERQNCVNKHIEADYRLNIQTNPVQVEADEDEKSEREELAELYEYLKGSDSDPVEARKSSTVPSCKLEKDASEFDLLENIVSQADIPNDVDGGACEEAEADASRHILMESLRFEVSQYTRRVHLYICIPGQDSRPRPLSENFRPEELESMMFSAGNVNHRATLHLLKTFAKEWSSLRPIERSKLFGKPLQLPLSLELCYLKKSMNHECGGLLKGGSKRRVTPLSDISHPLPENAVWKKVALHCGTTKEKEYSQAWTLGNEPLCKLCQKPCNGKLAKSPEYFEDLFCNLSCYQEYRIRTSQRALREALFQIEHGVCTQCKLDCHKLVKCIRPLSTKRRQEHIKKVAPDLASKKKLLAKLVHEPIEGNAWHADHIVPVFKGGGECRLENMRTLCVSCHYEVTKAQRSELRQMRTRAKKQLKLIMKELEDKSNMKPTDSNAEVSRQNGERGELVEEDALFITVPGSAYSGKESIVMPDGHELGSSLSR